MGRCCCLAEPLDLSTAANDTTTDNDGGISRSPSPRASKDGSKSNKGGGRGARVAVAPGGAASYQAEEQRLLSRKGILKRIAGKKTGLS